MKNSIFLLSWFLFFSCSKEKLEADVPAYLSIDAISLTTNYLEEGSNSQNITDAWVYINDNLIGVYELPAKFPVLYEGSYELKVYGGIKENGIAATRTRYLFYAPYVEQVNFVEGETITISPNVNYSAAANFVWLEDFEQAGISFSSHTDSDTIINRSVNSAFEGNHSGEIYLEQTMNFVEVYSIPISGLPKNGNPIFLELNFKTNQPIFLGVQNGIQKVAIGGLNATEEWKKIYVSLTDAVQSLPGSSDVEVFFGLENTLTNPFTVEHPNIFLDNIKLVHF